MGWSTDAWFSSYTEDSFYVSPEIKAEKNPLYSKYVFWLSFINYHIVSFTLTQLGNMSPLQVITISLSSPFVLLFSYLHSFHPWF